MVIVGAGVAGLMTALESLAQKHGERQRIVVLSKAVLGAGAATAWAQGTPDYAAIIAAPDRSDADREAVRSVLVGELARLGPEEPLARETRRRLAAVLF